MHDIARFERRGLPSAALISSAFLPQARWQARELGMAGVAHLLVPVEHPMSDKTPSQMYAKADACYEACRSALTTTTPPGAAFGGAGGEDEEEEKPPAAAGADCAA